MEIELKLIANDSDKELAKAIVENHHSYVCGRHGPCNKTEGESLYRSQRDNHHSYTVYLFGDHSILCFK